MNVVGSGCYTSFIGAVQTTVSFSQIHNLVFPESKVSSLGGVPDLKSSAPGLTAHPACFLHVDPGLDGVVTQHSSDDRLATTAKWACLDLNPLAMR